MAPRPLGLISPSLHTPTHKALPRPKALPCLCLLDPPLLDCSSRATTSLALFAAGSVVDQEVFSPSYIDVDVCDPMGPSIPVNVTMNKPGLIAADVHAKATGSGYGNDTSFCSRPGIYPSPPPLGPQPTNSSQPSNGSQPVNGTQSVMFQCSPPRGRNDSVAFIVDSHDGAWAPQIHCAPYVHVLHASLACCSSSYSIHLNQPTQVATFPGESICPHVRCTALLNPPCKPPCC